MERDREQGGRVQLELTDRAQPVEWSAEILLPDYRSEISRLLWVRPTFLPPQHFVGGGKAELSGAVRYHILYVGPDGALYSTESEENYGFSVPLEMPAGFAGGVELTADLTPDAVISRVTGPRKLSVRCRLHARICGYGERETAPRIKGESDGREPHRLCDVAECGRVAVANPEYFTVSDRFDPEGGEGELRVIAANGNVLLSEVNAAGGSIRCRGEAVITLLLCREETAGEAGMPFAVRRQIPFEQELVLEDATPEWTARAMGEIGEIRTAVEDGQIALEVQGVLWGEGQTEDSVILCRDLYLPGKTADCRMGEVPLWHPTLCEDRHFTVSGERSLAEAGIPADAVLLYTVADAEMGEREITGSGTVLSGQIHCHTLYTSGGEFAVGELTLPFRTVLEGKCDSVHVSCRVPDCRLTVSREAVRADAEISLALRGCGYAPIQVVAEATLLPGESRPRADLEICYPAARESLWDVGKRYGVSPEELAAANGIGADAPGEADSLAGVRYLLIP